MLAQQIVAEVAAQEWSEDALFALFRRSWPYPRSVARGFRRGRGDAGRGLHHPARPPRRADPSRRGQWPAARPARGAADGADLGRHDPRQRRLPGHAGARKPGRSAPSTRISRSRAWPATSFSSATNPTASCASSAARCASRMPRACRQTFRSGSARRPAAATSCRRRCRACAGNRPRVRSVANCLSHLNPPPQAGEGMSERGAGREPPPPALSASGAEAGARPRLACRRDRDRRAGGGAVGRLFGRRRRPHSGCLPTHDTIVFERFFDAVGGMQLVVHSPYGSRINRAWGLALRKRFCRKFNFELQAAATEDNIVLSLTTAHSFDLAEVQRYLHSASVRKLLIEAVLDAPMFMTRWRWVAGVALSLPRFRGGKKVPPPLWRAWTPRTCWPRSSPTRSPAPRTSPAPAKSPITRWCARRSPIASTRRWTRPGSSGCWRARIRRYPRSSRAIWPNRRRLALEVLAARPYAYLDDAPLEERRTQAVMARRWLAPEEAAELGRLDPQAIARVREEAWPEPANRRRTARCPRLARVPDRRTKRRTAEPGWTRLARRARSRDQRGSTLLDAERHSWVAAERLPQFRALWPDARLDPPITAPAASREGMAARGGAGRDPARPARRPGAGRPRHTRRAARARRHRHRRRACCLGSRRLRACAAGSRPVRRRRRNGASGGCSPASTAIR